MSDKAKENIEAESAGTFSTEGISEAEECETCCKCGLMSCACCVMGDSICETIANVLSHIGEAFVNCCVGCCEGCASAFEGCECDNCDCGDCGCV